MEAAKARRISKGRPATLDHKVVLLNVRARAHRDSISHLIGVWHAPCSGKPLGGTVGQEWFT
jgi:hypothetical protein